MGLLACLFAWDAFSPDEWRSANHMAHAAVQPGTSPSGTELPSSRPIPSEPNPEDIANIDIRALDGLSFGAKEALQSVTTVVSGALKLDAGAPGSYKSSDREMVRIVGGAKFVSNR